MSFPPFVSLSLAYLLDQTLGDPHFRLHPVRLLGDIGEIGRRIWYAWGRLGGLLTLLFSAACFMPVAYLLGGLPLGEAVLIYFFIAERALCQEAMLVGEALAQGRLDLARLRLSRLVGRETKDLDLSQCVRAAVETVAENFTDAFVGPLFWYLFGGVLGMTFYKCVETLDSMYGYKTPKWRQFGFFPAKVDDLLNFLPARLAALFLAFAAGLSGLSFKRAFQTMRQDARKHDSPNSGWTEAAMAGALGIELGGEVVYHGKRFEKGRLGRPLRERRVEDIFVAVKIIKRAGFLFFLMILILEVGLWSLGFHNLIQMIWNVLKGVWIA